MDPESTLTTIGETVRNTVTRAVEGLLGPNGSGAPARRRKAAKKAVRGQAKRRRKSAGSAKIGRRAKARKRGRAAKRA